MEKKNVDMDNVVEKLMDTADDVKEVAKVTAAAAKSGAKKAVADAKKATKTAKKSIKKLSVTETYIQFAGREYKESSIVEQVETAYKAAGHRVGSVKTMELYVKPEENAAYYVINGKHSGKVELVESSEVNE